MLAWVSAFLLVSGSAFVLVAALGVARLPDTLSRMHAATKAGAFGASLMLAALVLHLGGAATVVKAVLVIVFFYATAPIAAHLLGRLAYRRGTGGTFTTDEWAGARPAGKDDPGPPS